MIYAAQIKKTDSAITVGAYNNRPLVPVRAFDNKSEFDAEQDRLWQGDRFSGDNLVRVTRKQVEKWFGKTFSIRDDGTLGVEGDY
jgi:hypothetical protein